MFIDIWDWIELNQIIQGSRGFLVKQRSPVDIPWASANFINFLADYSNCLRYSKIMQWSTYLKSGLILSMCKLLRVYMELGQDWDTYVT